MGGVKKRAGLFVIDVNGNTCCIIRSTPYALSDRNIGRYSRKYTVNMIFNRNAIDNDRIVLLDSGDDGIKTVSNDDDESYTFEEYNINSSFLEMIQIPRGSKEQIDEDLMYTAVREFYEETLCANNKLEIYTEPFKLYWEDDGKRWTYSIFIANTKGEPLYFSFEPGQMQNVNYVQNNNNSSTLNYSYSLHIAKISRQMMDVYNSMVIIDVRDYIHYMQHCQLEHYGNNNYMDFLSRISVLLLVNNTMRSRVNNRINMKDDVYNSILKNKRSYVRPFESNVYLKRKSSIDMKRCWQEWWQSRYNNTNCPVPPIITTDVSCNTGYRREMKRIDKNNFAQYYRNLNVCSVTAFEYIGDSTAYVKSTVPPGKHFNVRKFKPGLRPDNVIYGKYQVPIVVSDISVNRTEIILPTKRTTTVVNGSGSTGIRCYSEYELDQIEMTECMV